MYSDGEIKKFPKCVIARYEYRGAQLYAYTTYLFISTSNLGYIFKPNTKNVQHSKKRI